MTLAARTSIKPRRPGFTLLELVVVLVIIAMVMGGAVAYQMGNATERKLKTASGKVEVMAKRARSIALLQQKPYAIEFTPGSVRLMPLAEALAEGGRPGSRPIRAAQNQAQADGQPASIHDSYSLEAGTMMSVRRWGNDRWFPIRERERQVWRFDPDGLCEPIGLRFQIENSWMASEYHPLTAAVRDTTSEIR